MKAYGTIRGDVCNRNGCTGIIDEQETDGCCSCHINPPCSFCVDDRHYCPVCGWEAIEEQRAYNDKVSKETKPFEYKRRTIEDLDKTKIDWIYKPHTHFTMLKEGVYPKGATKEDVFKEVQGSFGGRFDKFENGHFIFIAYTD
jgi:hypothetical protein